MHISGTWLDVLYVWLVLRNEKFTLSRDGIEDLAKSDQIGSLIRLDQRSGKVIKVSQLPHFLIIIGGEIPKFAPYL